MVEIKRIVIAVLIGTNLLTGFVIYKWSNLIDGIYFMAHNSYKTGCLVNKGSGCEEQAVNFVTAIKRFSGEQR